MPERLRWIVVISVLVVWIANFSAGLVIPGYEPAESINGIFMAIVGGALALSGKREGNGKSNG